MYVLKLTCSTSLILEMISLLIAYIQNNCRIAFSDDAISKTNNLSFLLKLLTMYRLMYIVTDVPENNANNIKKTHCVDSSKM